ncbi:MAG: hypothetical protein ACE5JS_21875, partial [Nitrospinota bacterium]
MKAVAGLLAIFILQPLAWGQSSDEHILWREMLYVGIDSVGIRQVWSPLGAYKNSEACSRTLGNMLVGAT